MRSVVTELRHVFRLSQIQIWRMTRIVCLKYCSPLFNLNVFKITLVWWKILKKKKKKKKAKYILHSIYQIIKPQQSNKRAFLTKITLLSFVSWLSPGKSFHIRQHLNISHLQCIHFSCVYRVTFSLNAPYLVSRILETFLLQFCLHL